MGLETANTIEELNEAWPLGSDGRNFGDDHLRLIKHVLKQELASGRIGGSGGAAGELFPFAGAAAPSGALVCDGQVVAQADYPELYAAIGDLWATTAGAADPGAGNFRLPPRVNANGKNAFLMPVPSGSVGAAYNPLVPEHNHSNNHDHGSQATTSNGSHSHDLWMGDDDSGAANSKVLEIREPQAGEYQDTNAHTDGSPPAVVKNWVEAAGAHTHNVNLPNYTGVTGTTGTANDNRPPSIGVLLCIWTGKAAA